MNIWAGKPGLGIFVEVSWSPGMLLFLVDKSQDLQHAKQLRLAATPRRSGGTSTDVSCVFWGSADCLRLNMISYLEVYTQISDHDPRFAPQQADACP